MSIQGWHGLLSSPVAANTRSHAPADSELAQVLAGRARWLYERTVNNSAESTATPYAGPNPQGTGPGHDHSGPPYGSVMLHPLFTLGGFPLDGNINPDENTATTYNPLGFCGGGSSPDVCTIGAEVWIRPHSPILNAPYSRGHLSLSAINDSAGSPTITVETWANEEASGAHSGTFSVTSSAAPPAITSFAGEPYWRLRSGRNMLWARFSSNSGSVITYITGMSANVIVKRSH